MQTVAKEAAPSTNIPECYDKVTKNIVKSELELLGVEKRQMEWDRSTKGKITKQYFPNRADRLKNKPNLTHYFTIMVTGNCKIN